MSRLEKKLEILKEEKRSLDEEMAENKKLGRQVKTYCGVEETGNYVNKLINLIMLFIKCLQGEACQINITKNI